MQYQLQKAINLARKTGDRLIIFDYSRPSDAYVVMSLDEYERLVMKRSEVHNLTEEELIDKINRDVAIWKSENESDDFDNYFPRDFKGEKNEPASREYFYGGGLESLEKEILKKKDKIKNSNWAIPPARKRAAEEIIEEDRQYFEEINF